jgi:thiol:disulfide interchange protein
MDYFNIVPWLGVPLLATLLFLITRKQLRALALATLLIAVPLSIMLASNNNHANTVRNFFMGILFFAVPLLFHAWVVSFIKQKQSNPSFKRDD